MNEINEQSSQPVSTSYQTVCIWTHLRDIHVRIGTDRDKVRMEVHRR